VAEKSLVKRKSGRAAGRGKTSLRKRRSSTKRNLLVGQAGTEPALKGDKPEKRGFLPALPVGGRVSLGRGTRENVTS